MILSISLNFILMKWIEGEGVEFPFFIFSILVFPTFFLCVFPSGRSFSFQGRKKVGLRTKKVGAASRLDDNLHTSISLQVVFSP